MHNFIANLLQAYIIINVEALQPLSYFGNFINQSCLLSRRSEYYRACCTLILLICEKLEIKTI